MIDAANIEIRRLGPGDEQRALKAILELKPEDERAGRQPSLSHLQSVLGQETNYLIVASHGSTLTGFLTAYRMPSFTADTALIYLYEIEVAPAYRRRGIGRQMIDLLKELGQSSGAAEIWVGTENDNVAAKGLYQSTGGVCEGSDNCEFVYALGNEPPVSAG
ncbi:MAG: GNAT family N-acetyltransferase [Candidatus Latescibacteria bacterium]|nr:GNAT family N-acetyltransferase [Candidatus Latescibacterota bacterium]